MYRIAEVFTSLQGEGYHAGKAAVFVRFSGCNLACDFCDTDHSPRREFQSAASLGDHVRGEFLGTRARHLVITGGEPALQLDRALLMQFRAMASFIQLETNGTVPLAPEVLQWLDWVTVSPKTLPIVTGRIDEIKLLYPLFTLLPHELKPFIEDGVPKHFFLQPCAGPSPHDTAANSTAAADYCRRNPPWRLSLQMHKVIGIR